MSHEALLHAVRGEAVAADQAEALMRGFADGDVPSEVLAAFLTALAIRGEQAPALAGLATVLRDRMTPVDLGGVDAIDVCGTGGDGQKTVNISTAATFVVAAAGVPVAKHGNHGVSSAVGSSDVLAALDMPYKLAADEVAEMVRAVGVGFIYAPACHPVFATVGPVRRALGFRTAFNMLGPVCNPARVTRQLLGVANEAALHTMAELLSMLGTRRALVVHTPGPYDEISLTAPALGVLVDGDSRREITLAPADFGVEAVAPADLVGTDSAGNAARIHDVMAGETSGLADAICANAAAALFVAERVATVKEGFDMARAVIDNGAAADLMRQAQRYSPTQEVTA